MTVAERIGRRLKEARVWRGFTRKQVCQRIGKDGGTLFRYETGKSEPPFELLSKLCKLYGVTMAAVVDPKNAKNTVQ